MKMRFLRAAFVSLALCAVGVNAHEAKILQRTDKFSGGTFYFSPFESVKLEGGSFWSGRYVLVQMSTTREPGAKWDRLVTLNFEADLSNWAFIREGNSLDLKIDGKMVSLAGRGSADNRSVLDGGHVHESAYYVLPEDVQQKLAQAKNVDFRLYGSSDFITGTFSQDTLADFRFFIDKIPGVMGVSPAELSSSPAPVRLGVDFMSVPGPTRSALRIPDGVGVLIVRVQPGSPAEQAGVTTGDVVTSFDGKDVHSIQEMQRAVVDHQAGQQADIGIVRGGQVISLKASM